MQSDSLLKIKQSQQAEFIIQMAIDLVMDTNLKLSDVSTADLPAIKFKAFRAMAFCKLQQGDIHSYIRNLLVALSIADKC